MKKFSYLDSLALCSSNNLQISSGSEKAFLNEHFSPHVTMVEIMELLVIRVQIDEVPGYGHADTDAKEKSCKQTNKSHEFAELESIFQGVMTYPRPWLSY